MTTHDTTTDATPVRPTAFDNYEIGPCTRTEEPNRPGHFYFEACEPHEADVWTLYGHIPGEGADAIGDFASREHAEETFQRITGIAFADSRQVEARLRVMHAGPHLFEALVACANLLADHDDSEGEEGDAYREAVAALDEAGAGDRPDREADVRQQVDVTLRLSLWLGAAMDDGGIASHVRGSLRRAFGEEFAAMADPVTVLDVRQEAAIYGVEEATVPPTVRPRKGKRP